MSDDALSDSCCLLLRESAAQLRPELCGRPLTAVSGRTHSFMSCAWRARDAMDADAHFLPAQPLGCRQDAATLRSPAWECASLLAYTIAPATRYRWVRCFNGSCREPACLLAPAARTGDRPAPCYELRVSSP